MPSKKLSKSRHVNPQMTLQGHFIPNSHLDREWGMDYQQTRKLTVAFLDAVLDIFKKVPEYTFLLDSQTVPLEDYLEIRPGRREELIAYIKAGRMNIGPWYTAPDCNCINGESIARNLLMGHRVAREYGPVMKVGYTPFGFGQVSQLPQIYQNFGIDTALYYRGVTKESAPEAEFTWESPDGTRVLACRFGHAARYNLYMYVWRPVLYKGRMIGDRREDRLTDWTEGGVPFKFAGLEHRFDNYFLYDQQKWYNPDDVEKYFRKLLEKERQHFTTPIIPLMQGMDTSMPDPFEADLVKRIQEILLPGEEVIYSSMPKFVAALKKHLAGRDLRVLKGEMRQPAGGGTYFATLAGDVISNRPRQKQLSAQAERLLQRWTEVWAALAWLMGEDYPETYLEYAWKKLLHCHAHDTIGGCGIDDLEKDATWRLRQVINLCRAQLRDTLGALQTRIDTSAIDPRDVVITVFNPLPVERTEVVAVAVDVPDGMGVVHIKVEDANGGIVQFHEGRRRDTEKVVRSPYDVTNALKCNELEIQIFAEKVPALGWKTFLVRGAEHSPAPRGLASSATAMENEHLRVEFDDDGTLELTHKASGKKFENLHIIEDGGESGEPWTRHAPMRDRVITSIGAPVEFSLIENTNLSATIRVRNTLDIPVRMEHDTMYWDTWRSGETRPLVITSDFTLRAGSDRLDVETRLDNQHRHHRLRVLFPTGLNRATHSYAEQAFDVVERIIDRNAPSKFEISQTNSESIGKIRNPKSEIRNPEFPFPPFHTTEHPHAVGDNPTYPMLRFCGISDGECGLAIIVDGMNEYEAKEDSERTLALTLIRAYEIALCTVSYRWERLPEMDGSQSLGPHLFRYALFPHAGNWESGEVVQAAEKFSLPMLPAQSSPARNTGTPMAKSSRKKSGEGLLPLDAGFIRVSPSSVQLSAIKKAEAGRSLIVRLFNPTTSSQVAAVNVSAAIRQAGVVTMEEKPSRETYGLKVKGQIISLAIPAKKVVTLKITIGN